MKTIILSVSFFALTLLLATQGIAAQFQVNDTRDELDLNPGDGQCLSRFDTCTLRAAVQESSALGGNNHIELQAEEYQLSIIGSNENEGARGDLDIRGHLSITAANHE